MGPLMREATERAVLTAACAVPLGLLAGVGLALLLNLNLRGIQGAIQGETTAGSIEASLGTAPKGAQQRLATTTGDIEIGVDD